MNTLERKLPIGIQTFEDIRRGNYLYVDKTSILLAKVCLFLLLKPIFRVVKTFLRVWQLKS